MALTRDRAPRGFSGRLRNFSDTKFSAMRNFLNTKFWVKRGSMNTTRRNQYRQALRRVLEGTGAKFTIVQFIKQDGSLRTMLIQHAAAKFRVKEHGAQAC